MHITPIALGDPPLLNAAGLHAPYCLRTVVELKTDDGLTGLAEVPGSVAVDAALAAVRDVVIGADPRNWHGLRARLAERCSPETSVSRGDKPWDGRTRVQVYSALDVACLDIQGKAFGVPVAALLGGVVRERVPYSAYLFYKYEGAGGALAFGTDPEATGWAAARQAAALDPAGVVAQAQVVGDHRGHRFNPADVHLAQLLHPGKDAVQLGHHGLKLGFGNLDAGQRGDLGHGGDID